MVANNHHSHEAFGARSVRHADFGPERRATVTAMLADDEFQSKAGGLSSDARTLYVVGALVCNSVGVVRKDELNEALNDPSVIQYASTLLRRAGF